MDSCLKIRFKDKEYIIDNIVDFSSEHSILNKKHNVYQVIANEIPNGLLTATSSNLPVKIEILDQTIWRPSMFIRTKMNPDTKKLQYIITIDDKGE